MREEKEEVMKAAERRGDCKEPLSSDESQKQEMERNKRKLWPRVEQIN